MRVALVGWDSDDAVSAALAGLGVDLVVLTRWFPDLARQEDRSGWVKLRCPHQIGGGPTAEARAFSEAVLARLSDCAGSVGEASARGAGFDIVHAADPLARPAAEALAAQQPSAVRVGTLGLADVQAGAEGPSAGSYAAVRWVSDHPWVADAWRGSTGGEATVVPTPALVEPEPDRPTPPARQAGPLAAFWIERSAEVDPAAVAKALAEARSEVAGLCAVVLGSGHAAQALRRRLAEHRLLADGALGPCDSSPRTWAGWVAAADVLGLAGKDLADDPAAWAAWSFGTPVVSLDAARPSVLAERLRAAILVRGRYDDDVKAGAALAKRRLAPSAVAAGWLGLYLDAIARPEPSANTSSEAPAELPLVRGGRSRLALVALGCREAYAAWHVRPEDRATAMQWLGPDAVRAMVTLRLTDVTDLLGHGGEAHVVWDIELAQGEPYRSIGVPGPGRSISGCLGLKSPRGQFHPLAHAGPVHLPQEAETPNAPTRRLQVLPRRTFRPAR